ncbi:MAG TPA: tRNA 2-selenouridine(34) synthase MnmH, partial [Anaerolineae bacterium]|nr:tRNA 2-selenouridine(34) synthase MnmH [Anaerolineae bacterium]
MIDAKELDAFLQTGDSLPIIDVRSEAEYAKGHIPGSINIPLLTNEQRVQVGTLYKQMGREAAVMKGFQLVGPQFYDRFKAMRKLAHEQELRIYCWRGGMRSNIMAWMMNLAEYRVHVLQGGYKAWRQYAHELFAQSWQWTILAGKTGVGKTALLRQLALRGEQVLDFEQLANHKGSAFGHLGQEPQPTVEHFENLLAWKLKDMDIGQPIWIENESRFIGKVRIPDALFNQAIHSPVVEVERHDEER